MRSSDMNTSWRNVGPAWIPIGGHLAAGVAGLIIMPLGWPGSPIWQVALFWLLPNVAFAAFWFLLFRWDGA